MMKVNLCPICGNKTSNHVHPKTKIIYHICRFCKYIQKDIDAFPSHEASMKKYLEHHNSLDQEDYVIYLKAFLDAALWPYVHKKDPLGLDYGCGNEPVLKEILKRDYDIEAFAYDPNFHNDQAYLKNHYDFIVSTEVFEHLADPLGDLRCLKGLLKSGGVIAIMTLFYPKDITAFNDWWYIRDVTHIGFFTAETFKVMAKIIDLEMVYTNNNRYVTLKKSKA